MTSNSKTKKTRNTALGTRSRWAVIPKKSKVPAPAPVKRKGAA